MIGGKFFLNTLLRFQQNAQDGKTRSPFFHLTQYSNRRLHKMRGANRFFRAVILAMMMSFCAEGRRKNPSEEPAALPKKLKAGDIKTPVIIGK